MDHETMRSLIGAILLCAMGIAAVVMLIRKNRDQIREICFDENGKFDPLGGLEKRFSQSGGSADPRRGTSSDDGQELSADENFMELLKRQKGTQMAGFDPETALVREHLIFHGRVQGVGFRYQAMVAAQERGLTGWVKNLPDGSVEMEVQGTGAGIGRMLSYLGGGHWIRIDDLEAEELPPVSGEKGFTVRGY